MVLSEAALSLLKLKHVLAVSAPIFSRKSFVIELLFYILSWIGDFLLENDKLSSPSETRFLAKILLLTLAFTFGVEHLLVVSVAFFSLNGFSLLSFSPTLSLAFTSASEVFLDFL